MPKLLCATDLHPKSEPAIDRAGQLAAQLDAELTLLHVVSPAMSERTLEESLQMAIGHMQSRARPPSWRYGTKPELVVRAGSPSRLIPEAVERHEADLLIIGPHRKRGLRDVLEGTIAAKTLSARQAPLLIVREKVRAEYRNVLLALDLSADFAAAVRAAESLILGPQARATVMHASEAPYEGMLRSVGVSTAEVMSYADYSRREAAVAVRDLLRQVSTDHSRYDVMMTDSHPAPAILRAVEIHRPDLLIMGTRGDGRVRRALIGSVANRVLDAVECDVLVVPRGSC